MELIHDVSNEWRGVGIVIRSIGQLHPEEAFGLLFNWLLDVNAIVSEDALDLLPGHVRWCADLYSINEVIDRLQIDELL